MEKTSTHSDQLVGMGQRSSHGIFGTGRAQSIDVQEYGYMDSQQRFQMHDLDEKSAFSSNNDLRSPKLMLPSNKLAEEESPAEERDPQRKQVKTDTGESKRTRTHTRNSQKDFDTSHEAAMTISIFDNQAQNTLLNLLTSLHDEYDAQTVFNPNQSLVLQDG